MTRHCLWCRSGSSASYSRAERKHAAEGTDSVAWRERRAAELIPVFRPSYDEEELEALRQPFESGWIGLGPKTRELEHCFVDFLGAGGAIAVNSCTAALHLAMIAVGATGGEVITPSLTFVSTNHAVLFAGAKPVFADVDPITLCLDPSDVERRITPSTRAIVVMHYGGHPCDMDAFSDLAKAHGLALVEDCAHACGAQYKGRPAGSMGDVGCFSFHAVKNLATGDGGMLTASAHASVDMERVRRLAWLGISKGTWERSEGSQYSFEYEVEELGFKYHMNDIAASLGLVQFKKLAATNARRRQRADRYLEALSDLAWMRLPDASPEVVSAWHNFVIRIDPEIRDRFRQHLSERGIATGVHYVPNHLHRMYRQYSDSPLPVSESEWLKLVTLPLYPDLSDEDQAYVIETVRGFPHASR